MLDKNAKMAKMSPGKVKVIKIKLMLRNDKAGCCFILKTKSRKYVKRYRNNKGVARNTIFVKSHAHPTVLFTPHVPIEGELKTNIPICKISNKPKNRSSVILFPIPD
ncbi:MAG: hypothetical protein QM710_09990 [Flavobacterium sp.]